MIVYLTRRLFAAAGILLVICAVTFLIFYVIPADPALQACGKTCTPERVADVRAQMGLDRPVHEQFGAYVAGVFAGRTLGSGLACGFPCFGFSYQNSLPVWDLLVDRLGASVSLAIGAALLWLATGLAIGVLSALRQGTRLDRSLMVATLTSASLPVYFVAMLLLLLVVRVTGILPYPAYVPPGEDLAAWAGNLILPWVTLAALYAALYARLSRAQMIETLAEPYIRTARAKGLPERTVVVKHGMRAAMTPIVTIFGMDLGGLLAGAMITETVFGLPGIGRLAYDGVVKSDQPVILGTTLLAAFFIVFANLAVDLLYVLIDPRVRYS
ncbi:ABC transporter permease [Sphaerisporangium siamense]|uniref:Peptide/nickel transport system permease protein n=1 Tax=Sphaerisporangium siamense TaxID=795645 RepID=A0A7W7GDI9_9ACTN|nr:ABC transporter permease [Sphaerisporangium siamense]MBB4703076.1 peptide/nickel transport system permease protein [Sphaerisporangium siamense]GII83158.1 ABC transporter permease [Sphaerisporangium siamense]